VHLEQLFVKNEKSNSSSIVQSVPEKWFKVYSTIILQPSATESCDFQQNVYKEIVCVTNSRI